MLLQLNQFDVSCALVDSFAHKLDHRSSAIGGLFFALPACRPRDVWHKNLLETRRHAFSLGYVAGRTPHANTVDQGFWEAGKRYLTDPPKVAGAYPASSRKAKLHRNAHRSAVELLVGRRPIGTVVRYKCQVVTRYWLRAEQLSKAASTLCCSGPLARAKGRTVQDNQAGRRTPAEVAVTYYG